MLNILDFVTIDDILKLSYKYNKQVIITTNGSLLKSKQDILKKHKNIQMKMYFYKR